MKKGMGFLTFGAALAIAGLLCACTPSAPSGTAGASPAHTDSTPVSSHAARPTDPGSHPFVDGDSYSAAEAAAFVEISSCSLDGSTLTLTLRNKGSKAFSFGKQYTIEKQTEKGWEALPFRKDAMWEAIGILLAPGGEGAYTYDLSELSKTPKPGEYRIKLEGYDLYGAFQVS